MGDLGREHAVRDAVLVIVSIFPFICVWLPMVYAITGNLVVALNAAGFLAPLVPMTMLTAVLARRHRRAGVPYWRWDRSEKRRSENDIP